MLSRQELDNSGHPDHLVSDEATISYMRLFFLFLYHFILYKISKLTIRLEIILSTIELRVQLCQLIELTVQLIELILNLSNSPN